MIQRIQSIWLLLAALMSVFLFMTPIYKTDTMAMLVNSPGNYVLLILAVIMIALPLAAVFMFKNRKRQRNLALLGIVVNIGFVAFMLMRISNYNNTPPLPVNGRYWFGSVFPILSIIFLVMAMSAIRKDDKLVRSADRLR